MAEKIADIIMYVLLGIDGLIVLCFFFLLFMFFSDPYGGTQGQILRELRKLNDPNFEKKELESHLAVSRALLYTFIFGVIFIPLSIVFIFLIFYLIEPTKA